MPTVNAIYNFLTQDKDLHLAPLTDKSNQSFVKVVRAVDVSAEPWAAGFHKIETHVTVYQYYEPELRTKTPLHFSAYLHHNNGATYCLHVHFDKRGHLVSGPLFQIKNTDNEKDWKSCPFDAPPDLHAMVIFLTSHAVKDTPAWLADINHKRHARLIVLKTDEQHFLSQYHQAVDPKEQQNHLKNLIKNLLAQQKIRPDLPHLSARIIYFQRLFNITQATTAATSPSKMALSAATPKEISDNAYNANMAKAPRTPGKTRTSQSLQDKIAQIKAQLLKLPSLTAEEQGTQCFDMMIELLNISETVENDPVSPNTKMEYNQLCLEVNRTGEQLYLRLLFPEVSAPFAREPLDKLKMFNECLSPGELNQAVIAKDIPRIAYILEQSPELVDAPVQLGKKTKYRNLISYCVALFERNTHTDFATECVKILLSHNVSLIVPMGNGLYFLEWLQIQPAHPLMPTLMNSNLFMDLETNIGLLNALQQRDISSLSEDKRREVEEKIKFYNKLISMLCKIKSTNSMFGLDLVKQSAGASQKLLTSPGLTLEEGVKLGMDTEFLSLQCDYLEILKRMMSNIPPEVFEISIQRGLFPSFSSINLSQYSGYEEKKAALITRMAADLAEMRVRENGAILGVGLVNSLLAQAGIFNPLSRGARPATRNQANETCCTM